MTPRKALEPRATWPITKSIMNRDGPRAPTQFMVLQDSNSYREIELTRLRPI
jgi:hypothetical protein